MTKLQKRVIELSHKNKLSHISSCLTTLPIIEHIYKVKKEEDIVVLGNSHAALALWVVLESLGKCDAEKMLKKYGTHAERDLEHGVYVSGGSLGQAETVAVGIALADRKRDVYLVTSDGACAEGSIWEALRISAEQRLENLRVTVIMNGYSAYGMIETNYLEHRLKSFFPVLTVQADVYDFPMCLQGVNGHYQVLDKELYEELIK